MDSSWWATVQTPELESEDCRQRDSGQTSWPPERHLRAQAETPVVQHNCCFPSFLLNLFSHWLNILKFHPWTTMGSWDLTLIFSLSFFF